MPVRDSHVLVRGFLVPWCGMTSPPRGMAKPVLESLDPVLVFLMLRRGVVIPARGMLNPVRVFHGLVPGMTIPVRGEPILVLS